MSIGLHDPHGRRRRRARRIWTRWLLAVAAIVAAGALAYQSGSTLAGREVEELRQLLADRTQRLEELETQNTGLQAELILGERRLEAAERRYERDIPSGPLKALTARVEAKLAEGVAENRLAFLIDSAGTPRECDNKPATKRFLVRTPIGGGANDSVSFAKGKITITALGESALNDEGKVVAWFDPAQAVTLRLTELGGKTTVKRGNLPIHTSVVVGDSEHIYSIVAGEQRGFVQVTGDRCDYP